MIEETFGQLLRRLRGDRPLLAVARAAGISTSYVYKLENDLGKPSRKVAEALDSATSARGVLIAAYESSYAKKANSPSTATMSRVRTVDTKGDYEETGEDTTERRRLLSLAAGAGILAGLDGEAVRRLLGSSLGAHRSVDEWHTTVRDRLHGLRHHPPAQVLAALSRNFVDLWQQMESQAGGIAELQRVCAMLAAIQANVLTRQGRHDDAIEWWLMARHAAQKSRDLDLELVVRSEEAGHGLYGQRSPGHVLDLVADARRLAGGQQMLKFCTVEAKAFAMLGRHQEALARLHEVFELTETTQGDKIGFWKDDQILFTESWVHSAAGRETQAQEARERLIGVADTYVYGANAQLHGAMLTVRLGGVDEGMQQAAQVLASIPAEFRTTHVMETTRMVLRGVPIDQRQRPAVRDLGAMLAIEA